MPVLIPCDAGRLFDPAPHERDVDFEPAALEEGAIHGESRWLAFAFEGGVELLEVPLEAADDASGPASSGGVLAEEAGARTVH